MYSSYRDCRPHYHGCPPPCVYVPVVWVPVQQACCENALIPRDLDADPKNASQQTLVGGSTAGFPVARVSGRDRSSVTLGDSDHDIGGGECNLERYHAGRRISCAGRSAICHSRNQGDAHRKQCDRPFAMVREDLLLIATLTFLIAKEIQHESSSIRTSLYRRAGPAVRPTGPTLSHGPFRSGTLPLLRASQ